MAQLLITPFATLCNGCSASSHGHQLAAALLRGRKNISYGQNARFLLTTVTTVVVVVVVVDDVFNVFSVGRMLSGGEASNAALPIRWHPTRFGLFSGVPTSIGTACTPVCVVGALINPLRSTVPLCGKNTWN